MIWCALILAAGKSTRAGESKLLREFRGAPWISYLVAEWCRLGASNVIVVVGSGESLPPEVTQLANLTIVRNSRWELGPLYSAQLGLAEATRLMVEAVLLSPVDVPPPNENLVAALLEHLECPRRPVHLGSGGHPVAIPARSFDAILHADPSAQALNTVLHELHMTDHHAADATVLENLNTPEAWEHWVRAQR